ncbi:MAG: glycosyl transferase, group 1 [Candidatus Peribacteria bacterium]|nr:glycosyl transferase, group 1 [Candidatus Peribacteria bacterium]
MNLLMLSGDRSILQGKKGAFWYTLEELSRHWDRIDVICPYAGPAAPGSHNPFPHVFFHPSPYGLYRQPWWILGKGTELVSKYRHSVMTVHEYPPFYNGIGASWLSRKTRVPYALEIHHIIGYPKAASCSEWIGRVLSHWYLRADARPAAAVRVVNGSVQTVLAKWRVPPEKIQIVPSFYLDADSLQPNWQAEKKYDLIFCARLVPNKGLREVLRAMVALPHVSLLIIGDGPERVRQEQFVEKHRMTDRIHFTGWLPGRHELADAMRSARVFVMNSSSEGGPRVLLEAMALGLPVIATGVGIVPDVIHNGENGIMTNGTAPDLAVKISALLADEPLREQLGRQATRIIDQFERQTAIRNYAEFLKAVSQ